ncbi:hypothetical protein ACEXQD_17105 [Herbiconiux sp. P15]|uniref:hypothetical protein n=1 Tax=Herbiconiux liukaitaii TaxID=3342799 RepID=UPI0035B82C73
MARRRGRGPRWLATGKAVEPPAPLPEHEVEAAIADGVLIARFSAVLTLKNRLIVASIRDEVPFEPENAARLAQEVLEAIAAEQDENTDHTVDVIGFAESDSGAARHEHDYKMRDLELLNARRRVYREVAERLRLDAADPEYVAGLVEEARVKAWDDISREIDARLDDARTAATVVVDDEYLRDRDERMRRLREFDLWHLADQNYGRRRARR